MRTFRITIGTCLFSLLNPFLKCMPIVGQCFVFTVKSFLSYSLTLLSLADIFLLLAYIVLFSFCLCAVVFFATIVFVVMISAVVLDLVVVFYVVIAVVFLVMFVVISKSHF